MAEDSRVKTERNLVDKWKSIKTKKRESVQTKKLIAAPCKNNIKTVVEEHVASENVYLPTFCWSMIMMK